MAFFKDRPDDLLVIDICSGEGFERLAPFLDRPVPTEAFPHKGAVLSRKMAEEAAAPKARVASTLIEKPDPYTLNDPAPYWRAPF